MIDLSELLRETRAYIDHSIVCASGLMRPCDCGTEQMLAKIDAALAPTRTTCPVCYSPFPCQHSMFAHGVAGSFTAQAGTMVAGHKPGCSALTAASGACSCGFGSVPMMPLFESTPVSGDASAAVENSPSVPTEPNPSSESGAVK